jgi:hypothetical protein
MLHHETDDFSLCLDNARLEITLKRSFTTIEQARAAVEPYLRAWELCAALENDMNDIHFSYKTATISHFNSQSDSSRTLIAVIVDEADSIAAELSVTFHVPQSDYPKPPAHFRISREVELLWRRYQEYLQGREPLLTMAYFCLTLIEKNAGGRTQAAKNLSVSEKILNKLGEVTSKAGDATSARKWNPTNLPLSATEAKWVKAVIKAIIKRLGETSDNHSLPVLTMSDFPEL